MGPRDSGDAVEPRGPRVARRSWLRYAAPLARLVIGGVWIVAGAAKLTDPTESAFAVRAYQLLPGAVADQVGYLLPPLEVVIGIALVLGLLTRGAALVSVVLLVAYVVAISSAWVRGLTIDCGCFGGGGELLTHAQAVARYRWDLARDVGLLVLSGLVVRLPVGRFALDSLLFARPRTSGRPDGSTATAGTGREEGRDGVETVEA